MCNCRLQVGPTAIVRTSLAGLDVVITDCIASRQIDPMEAQEFAKLNNAAWVETSAKENINVGEHKGFLTISSDPNSDLAQVFELCIGEIEKGSTQNAAYKPPPPRPFKCIIM